MIVYDKCRYAGHREARTGRSGSWLHELGLPMLLSVSALTRLNRRFDQLDRQRSRD